MERKDFDEAKLDFLSEVDKSRLEDGFDSMEEDEVLEVSEENLYFFSSEYFDKFLKLIR